MLVASVLHSELGPDGGCVPPLSEKSSESMANLPDRRPDPTAQSDRNSEQTRGSTQRDAYAEFQALGKLPDDLLDSPKSKPVSASGEVPWHERCPAGAVTEQDVAAVQAFVESFETVWQCLTHTPIYSVPFDTYIVGLIRVPATFV
jgi:hypothetical protein